MKLSHRISAAALLCSLLIALGCRKAAPNGSMTILMTDAPAAYDKVNIDVKQVMVHYDDSKNGDNGWVTLSTRAGIYNLLELRNNVTKVLADSKDLPPGRISQLRMILGDQNSVVIEGTTLPLKIPSAYTSGLKINVHSEIQSHNNLEMVLDFDAEQSVKQKGNSEYELNPVIKVKSMEYN